MKRIRIFVAYDGTNYCGWQVQPNGVTIEEKLNKALSRLTGEEIRIIGASVLIQGYTHWEMWRYSIQNLPFRLKDFRMH